MKFLPVIALSVLLFAATAAEAQLENDRALPIDEYNDVPKGLLLDKNGKDGTTSNKSSEPALDGLPQDGESPKHMSFDTAQKLYRQGKFAEALTGLVPLANSGNSAALELLGVMNRMGQGVQKNLAAAADYLTKAANDNRALAQHHLGVMYYTGEGVQADAIQALSWLQLAILHYPEGPEKIRAKQDRDNVYRQMNRRDREASIKITRDFLERKGEGHLLDLQQ